MTIGERIKSIREAKEISQADLARSANISKQTLWKYENNIISNIPTKAIESISRFLRVSPSYLLGWHSSFASDDHFYFYEYEENTSSVSNIPISRHEFLLLSAYRARPDMQPAVDRLLGIEESSQ